MGALAQIAIVLLAAVAFVALFRRLRLSSVLGYVAAGIAIGPHGLGWIAASADLQHVSEFGVVLLMFVIGLELQPSRLWVLRRTVFGLGAVQLAACGALLAAGAYAYGLRGPSAAVVAFGLAMSSTAMCLQVLAERQQLKTQHGRAAFGILLFQDLAVLPVLTLVPLLASGDGPGPALGWGLVKLAGAVAIILVAGRLLLRPVLRAVAATRVTEVFTAAALLIVVATALLVDAVGLSMSLGAFLGACEEGRREESSRQEGGGQEGAGKEGRREESSRQEGCSQEGAGQESSEEAGRQEGPGCEGCLLAPREDGAEPASRLAVPDGQQALIGRRPSIRTRREPGLFIGDVVIALSRANARRQFR